MAGRWFQRVVWIGIASNLVLAIPTLVAPAASMARAGVPAATPLVWPQFSALLLILLSIMYVPAALDFERYRITAWLTVASRLVGVIFFVGFQPREYRRLGYFDLIFFVPEAVLLTLAFRNIHTHDGTASPARARAIGSL
jgi:hypothetical protein